MSPVGMRSRTPSQPLVGCQTPMGVLKTKRFIFFLERTLRVILLVSQLKPKLFTGGNHA